MLRELTISSISMSSAYFGSNVDKFLTGGHDLLPFSALIVIQNLIGQSKALIPSNISMNGDSAPWYMPLTQFETVFLCLIMFQIFVLRYVEILPININNFFHGDPSGRKKRSLIFTDKIQHNELFCNVQLDTVTESILSLIQKLDEQKCFLRTLCFMASEHSQNKLRIPQEFKNTMSFLSRTTRIRRRSTCPSTLTLNSTDTEKIGHEQPIILFEEAVKFGFSESSPSTSTCDHRYKLCQLSRNDTLHYLRIIVQ